MHVITLLTCWNTCCCSSRLDSSLLMALSFLFRWLYISELFNNNIVNGCVGIVLAFSHYFTQINNFKSFNILFLTHIRRRNHCGPKWRIWMKSWKHWRWSGARTKLSWRSLKSTRSSWSSFRSGRRKCRNSRLIFRNNSRKPRRYLVQNNQELDFDQRCKLSHDQIVLD